MVRLTTDEGITGFGEGKPWDFVTGETLAANLAFLEENLVPAIMRFPAVSLSTLLPSLRLLHKKSGGKPPRGFLCSGNRLIGRRRPNIGPTSGQFYQFLASGPRHLQHRDPAYRRAPVDPVRSVKEGFLPV